jgi:hypothetical protein
MKDISHLGKRVISDVGEFWFWFLTSWVLCSVALTFFFCRLLGRDGPTPAPVQPEAVAPIADDVQSMPAPAETVALVRRELAEMVAEPTTLPWHTNPIYIELYELILDECARLRITMPEGEQSSNDWFLGSARDEESGK